jgi:hypothetical protein
MTTPLPSSSLRCLPLFLALATVPLGCQGGEDGIEHDDDGPAVGKGDEAAVQEGLEGLVADGELSAADVEALFAAAGNKVSETEMQLIEAALTDPALIADLDYAIAPDAMDTALELALRSNVFDYETRALDDAVSFGGTDIPDEVRQVVARARLAGARVYDIRELDGDCDPTVIVDDPDHPGDQVPQDCGRWAHYPAGSAPVGNMTFEYTEVTPESMDQSIADGGNGRISATGQPGEGSIFKKVSGQTWANNCAILVDGSLHCLPSHRTAFGVGLWLTNPALSRCPAQQFSATTDPSGDVDVEVDVEFFRMFLTGFQNAGIVQQLFPQNFTQAVATINAQLASEHQEAEQAAQAAAAQARSDAEANGVTDPAELDAIAEEAAQAARTESLSDGLNVELGGLDHLPEQEGVDYTEACKNFLWHGHIRADGHRITFLGTSGRPAKRVGRGNDVLVDPAAVLRAWGFDVPTETVSEHSTERHVTDHERHILVEP